MTITCPEPAVDAASAGSPQLDAEMAAAACCASVLEEAGLRVAFDNDRDGPLAIAIEGEAGESLRRLSVTELLALVALDPGALRAWARQPELPIPGRPPR